MPYENVISSYRDVINTRTKSKASIREDSEWYASTLAPIVGGRAGKLSPATGTGSAQGLTIQEQGTVSNVMPFDGESLCDDIRRTDLYLREARFVNRVSSGTVDMTRRILEFDADVLSPDFAPPAGRKNTDRVRYAALYSKDYRSTLYALMLDFLHAGILVRSDCNYIRMMLLEGMHLYMELYRLKDGGSYTTDITPLDMTRTLQNIEALIQFFTYKKDTRLEFDRYDIIHELRALQKAALQAKTDIIDYL